MKILSVITSLQTGGAEKLLVDSVPLYQKKGVLTDVVVLKDETTVFRGEIQQQSNVAVYGLTKGSVYSPFLILRLIVFIRKYDIVHVHLFPALYWVVFAKVISFSKIKIIYTEHNTSNKRRNNRLFKIIEKFVYSKLFYIGCISQGAKINLVNHLNYKKKNISVISNGIRLENFNCIERKDFKFFDKDSFILIQVASFRGQKDQPTLIKALKLLPNNIKLLLVGAGPLQRVNEELVRELGLESRVKFLGIRNDVPSLLHYADVCILSSNYEGFGLAVLEGMACGKPSIATNVEGVREIVDGYGLLFERGDFNGLADKILDLYNNDDYFNDVASKCFVRAKEFSINKMIDRYIEIYNNIF